MAKRPDLEAFLFSRPPTARTRNHLRAVLMGFGEFLIERAAATENLASGLPRIREPQDIPKALEPDAARRVLAAARAVGGIVEVLVMVLIYGGLRKSEARLLEWSDVDEDCSWVRFRGKGGKTRAVPLHRDARQVLRTWRLEAWDPRWVFPSPRFPGRPISERWMGEVIQELGELAGLSRLHPHLLRHTAATQLMEDGADLRTVQEFLGHADPKTTALYTRVRPARVLEAVERMEFHHSTADDDRPITADEERGLAARERDRRCRFLVWWARAEEAEREAHRERIRAILRGFGVPADLIGPYMEQTEPTVGLAG